MKIVVSICDQEMGLWNDQSEQYEKIYNISTAKNGPGEIKDSYSTPRGHAYVAEKIGAGQSIGTFFIARKPVAPEAVRDKSKSITTRILWLSGSMPGFNQYGDRDTKDRMIYIHGVPLTSPLPPRISHGCINMTDMDVLDLFDRVEVGTQVTIYENKLPPYYVSTGLGSLDSIKNVFPGVSSTADWYWVATSTDKNSSILGYIAIKNSIIAEINASGNRRESIISQMLEIVDYHCTGHGLKAISQSYNKANA